MGGQCRYDPGELTVVEADGVTGVFDVDIDGDEVTFTQTEYGGGEAADPEVPGRLRLHQAVEPPRQSSGAIEAKARALSSAAVRSSLEAAPTST